MARGKGKNHSQFSTNNTSGRRKYSIYVKEDVWRKYRELGGTIESVSDAAEKYAERYNKNNSKHTI